MQQSSRSLAARPRGLPRARPPRRLPPPPPPRGGGRERLRETAWRGHPCAPPCPLRTGGRAGVWLWLQGGCIRKAQTMAEYSTQNISLGFGYALLYNATVPGGAGNAPSLLVRENLAMKLRLPELNLNPCAETKSYYRRKRHKQTSENAVLRSSPLTKLSYSGLGRVSSLNPKHSYTGGRFSCIRTAVKLHNLSSLTPAQDVSLKRGLSEPRNASQRYGHGEAGSGCSYGYLNHAQRIATT